MGEYDHLPVLQPFEMINFFEVMYQGIEHWMNDSTVRFPERIFHKVD